MKNAIVLTLILASGACLRLYSCADLPASGDETISLIQASGKAHIYDERLQSRKDSIIRADALLWCLDYSNEYGLSCVWESMKKAGMHPPLYYLFLHGILKYTGNTTFTLRCISILLSLGSIGMVYLIGRELKDDTLGLMAAALFAVSTYGIHFAFMIRPYPAVMLTALTSAWIALRWCRKDLFRYRDIHYWTTVLLSAAGLYLIYHYIFFLAFLGSLLLFECIRRKKGFIVVLSIPVLTLLLYLPWIPSLLYQMRTVQEGHFYFHGLSNPFGAIAQMLTLNFTQFLPFKIIPSLIILLYVGLLGISGLLLLFKHKSSAFILPALIISIAVNFGFDLFLKTNTICVPKLMFFLSPVSLIIAAAGCRRLYDWRQWTSLLYVILFCLALIHSLYALPRSISIDGPYGRDLLEQLNVEISPSAGKLAVFNTSRRRYVFSLLHAMDSPPDVLFAVEKKYRESLEFIDDLDALDCVVIVCMQKDDETEDREDIRDAQGFLHAAGFVDIKDYGCVNGRVVILKKRPAPETFGAVQADTLSLRP